MDPTGRSAVTPEAIRLRLDVAEVGSRMVALMIDHAIQAAAVIGLVIVTNTITGDQAGEAGVIFVVVTVFVIVWGYFPAFEAIWRGQTPGKRVMKLRVISTDGSPATIPSIIVRNLIRLVDFLPASYGLGVISMLISKRAQRLGDLAAGTIVVREARPIAAATAELAPPAPGESRFDAASLTSKDDALIHGFLARRDSLDAKARAALAATIARVIRSKTNLSLQPGESDEAFIEAVARTLRNR